VPGLGIMVERPDLRLVEDPDRGPAVCVTCGEPATTSSAVDNAPLCLACFTASHWHPSWARSFDRP
jgi:formylmethanofuran dehydrogenase subunit E